MQLKCFIAITILSMVLLTESKAAKIVPGVRVAHLKLDHDNPIFKRDSQSSWGSKENVKPDERFTGEETSSRDTVVKPSLVYKNIQSFPPTEKQFEENQFPKTNEKNTAALNRASDRFAPTQFTKPNEKKTATPPRASHRFSPSHSSKPNGKGSNQQLQKNQFKKANEKTTATLPRASHRFTPTKKDLSKQNLRPNTFESSRNESPQKIDIPEYERSKKQTFPQQAREPHTFAPNLKEPKHRPHFPRRNRKDFTKRPNRKESFTKKPDVTSITRSDVYSPKQRSAPQPYKKTRKGSTPQHEDFKVFNNHEKDSVKQDADSNLSQTTGNDYNQDYRKPQSFRPTVRNTAKQYKPQYSFKEAEKDSVKQYKDSRPFTPHTKNSHSQYNSHTSRPTRKEFNKEYEQHKRFEESERDSISHHRNPAPFSSHAMDSIEDYTELESLKPNNGHSSVGRKSPFHKQENRDSAKQYEESQSFRTRPKNGYKSLRPTGKESHKNEEPISFRSNKRKEKYSTPNNKRPQPFRTSAIRPFEYHTKPKPFKPPIEPTFDFEQDFQSFKSPGKNFFKLNEGSNSFKPMNKPSLERNNAHQDDSFGHTNEPSLFESGDEYSSENDEPQFTPNREDHSSKTSKPKRNPSSDRRKTPQDDSFAYSNEQSLFGSDNKYSTEYDEPQFSKTREDNSFPEAFTDKRKHSEQNNKRQDDSFGYSDEPSFHESEDKYSPNHNEPQTPAAREDHSFSRPQGDHSSFKVHHEPPSSFDGTGRRSYTDRDSGDTFTPSGGFHRVRSPLDAFPAINPYKMPPSRGQKRTFLEPYGSRPRPQQSLANFVPDGFPNVIPVPVPMRGVPAKLILPMMPTRNSNY